MTARNERLPTYERLRRKRDFQKVYAEGRRVVGRFFVTHVLFKDSGPLRVGVVASRKLGGAVRRNRAKRMLREVFRRNKPAASVSADIVLIARVALLDAKYDHVEEEYLRTLRRTLESGGRASR